MKKILRMVLTAGFAFSLARAQPWVVDSTFSPTFEADTIRGPIDGQFVTADGKFSSYIVSSVINGRPFTAGTMRLNANGSVDDSFVTTRYLSKAAYADGRQIVTETDRVTSRVTIRRLLADGNLDASFVPVEVNDTQFRCLFLPDGRVLVAGSTLSFYGSSNQRMAMLGPNGGFDSSFVSPVASGSNFDVRSLALSADGTKVYLAGGSLSLGTGRNRVARLGLSGAIDLTFSVADSVMTTYGDTLFPQADGKLIVGNGLNLVRLTSTGDLDGSFTAAPVGTVLGIGRDLYGGKILYLTRVTGSPAQRQVRRLNLDGTDDAAFTPVTTPDAADYAVGIPVVGRDGNLYFGPITAQRLADHLALTRVSASGVTDASYNPRFSAVGTIQGYARAADGKHLVTGSFGFVNGVAAPAAFDLVRLNADGTTDSSFVAPAFPFAPSRLFSVAGSKTLVVGLFAGSANVIRLNADGSSDGTFQPIPGAVYSTAFSHYNVAVDSAGLVYVVTQDSPIVIKRFTADGQPDATFLSGTMTGASIYLCATSDGELAVARRDTSGQQFLTRLDHSGVVLGNVAYSTTNSSILGLAPVTNGDVAAVSLQSVTSTLYIARAKRTGAPDYVYSRYSLYNTSPILATEENVTDIAGAAFDLLRDGSSDSSAKVDFPVYFSPSGPIIGVRADGEAFVVSDFGTGRSLTKYLRTTLAAPSVSTPAPHFYFSNSVPSPTMHSTVGSTLAFGYSNIEGLKATLQWYKDGVPVAGQVAPTIFINPVKASDGGVYSLRATNAYGLADSDPVAVVIDGIGAVSISSQPASQTVTEGAAATFTVSATSPAAISYAWRRNGVPIAGATGSSYVVGAAALSDSGATYDVLVSSNGLTLTSTGATLTVIPATAKVFFGTISGGGSFALYIREDGSATMIGQLPGGRGTFLVRFTVNPDGSFSVALPAEISGTARSTEFNGEGGNLRATAAATISGQITGSNLTGVTSFGNTLSAVVQPSSGITSGFAGYYETPVLNTSSSAIAFVVGADGTVMAYGVNYLGGQVATGTLSAGGALSIAFLGGSVVQGTLNSSGKSLAGHVTVDGQTSGDFAGVSATITHTDRLVNISTRGLVGDGEKAMFAGFVITGSVPKTVLVRASGPTLGSFGVPGTMDNPVLSVLKGTEVVASNDDWTSSADASLLGSTATRVGGFPLNANGKDAALIASLAPGVYSAQITRASGSSVGLALIEVYDAGIDPGTESQKVVNISTRGEVKTGAEIMIAGFIITGNVPKKVLIRGVGPTLASFGVGQTLAHPQINLYQGTTFVASNDDWGANPALATEMTAAAAQVGAFPLNAGAKDAGLLVTLAPGLYSAQVSGVGGTTGVVLLEVYEVP